MIKEKWLAFVLGFSFFVSLNAQTKIFEIIPQIPNPGEQFTISYNPILTNLKEAGSISGLMYIYDDFKWIIKDISLLKTRLGTWETREQLPNHAALICCVFYPDKVVDYGGKESYTCRLDKSAGAYLAWAILHSAVFQKEIPVKVNETSFASDTITLKFLDNELQYHPESRKSIVFESLLFHKKIQTEDFEHRAKKEIRYVLNTVMDKRTQYSVQKSLGLLNQTTQKIFVDSVQKILVKKYPNGVLARDIALKKINSETNMDLKSKQYTAFVQKFPRLDFNEVYTDTEKLFNDKIYKSIANHSIAKYNDFSVVMNSLKEFSFANLIDFSHNLIAIPLDKMKAGNEKVALEILKVYVFSMLPEIQLRENYVPKEYREKLSLNQWRKMALQNAAPEYFSYAKIFEKLQNYKESQRLLEKIKSEFGFKNTSFNEMYFRMLIRNGKISEAKNYFEEIVKENKVTPEMLGLAKKSF